MARNTFPSIIPIYIYLIVYLLPGSLINAWSLSHSSASLPPDLCTSQIYCQGDLLKTVQLARIFNDSKTFVDHYQLNDPEVTLANFKKLMAQTGKNPTREQVRKFVRENFARENELANWTLPDWQPNPLILDRIHDEKFRKWVNDLNGIWKTLAKQIGPGARANPRRHSLINVENGFIVPGGRFQESYYWDSYWVVEGLLLTGLNETTRGILENFLWMVNEYGFVPNGGRIYYLMRSHPPLLIPMVERYLAHTENMTFLTSHLTTLEKEFDYFHKMKTVNVVKNHITYKMARYIVNSVGPRPESYREDYDIAENKTSEAEKQRFYNNIKAGAESGWDFSARWYMAADGGEGTLADISTSSIMPVDLNAFMQRNARILAEFNTRIKNPTKAEFYTSIADEYQRAIDNVLWNEEEGIWLDWDVVHSVPRNEFYPSNLTPLYTRSFNATNASSYANKTIAYLKRNKIGDFMGGTPASLQNTGEQWDMPNAWAPLQSIIVEGLRNTGVKAAMNLAEELAVRWLRSNYVAFAETGAMYEKYNAEKPGTSGGGGEYGVQPGFGWSNGVVLEFLNAYPEASSSDDLNDIPDDFSNEVPWNQE